MVGKIENDKTRWTCKKCGEIEPYNNEESFPICRCEIGNDHRLKLRKLIDGPRMQEIFREAEKPWR